MGVIDMICKKCHTKDSTRWWKCCPDHTTEQGQDVYCQTCVEKIHPGEEEFKWTISASTLMELTGATFRQVDYWCTNGLISPIGERNPGSGRRRQFDKRVANRVRLLANVSKVFKHLIHKDILQRINANYEEGSLDLGEGIVLHWGVDE